MLFSDDGDEPADPTDMLNELTKPEVTPKCSRWQTTYGVSFEKLTNPGRFWTYCYDETLSHVLRPVHARSGCLSQQDLVTVLKQLKSNPDKLRHKPQSVKDLEKFTGIPAVLKYEGFGAWHLSKPNHFSVFNNPFGISLGYTDSADDFEAWFNPKEAWPRKHQTVPQISTALSKFGMV